MSVLLSNLVARTPAIEDFPAIAELVEACDIAEHGVAGSSTRDLASLWQHDSFHLESDAWVIVNGRKQFVGFACVWHRDYESPPNTIQLTPWYSLPLAFLINFPLFLFVGGPLGEEAGWRGYVLPRLLRRRSALFSSLLVGMIWAVWHLPLFWIPGTGSGYGLVDFAWFFLLLSGWGVLLGWVYINTRGSLLLCVLYHAAGNTMTSAVLPVGGHDTLMMLVTVLTWVVVILVVIVAGPAHLSRTQWVERIR